MAPGSTSTQPRGRWSRAARWWLAAGTFVVGVLVGAVIVGLLSEGSPVPQADSGQPVTTVTPEPTSGSTPTATSGATIEIMVNEACLRALNAAEDAYGAISEIGDAVRELSAARLDEIIRRLQPLQTRLRDDIDACRVTTRLPDGELLSTSLPGDPAVTASPAPSTASTPTG